LTVILERKLDFNPLIITISIVIIITIIRAVYLSITQGFSPTINKEFDSYLSVKLLVGLYNYL